MDPYTEETMHEIASADATPYGAPPMAPSQLRMDPLGPGGYQPWYEHVLFAIGDMHIRTWHVILAAGVIGAAMYVQKDNIRKQLSRR